MYGCWKKEVFLLVIAKVRVTPRLPGTICYHVVGLCLDMKPKSWHMEKPWILLCPKRWRSSLHFRITSACAFWLRLTSFAPITYNICTWQSHWTYQVQLWAPDGCHSSSPTWPCSNLHHVDKRQAHHIAAHTWQSSVVYWTIVLILHSCHVVELHSYTLCRVTLQYLFLEKVACTSWPLRCWLWPCWFSQWTWHEPSL